MPAALPSAYAATALAAPDGTILDVRLEAGGKVRHLAGRGGAAAEAERLSAALAALAREDPQAGPPMAVLLGAGLGAGIEAALEAGCPAVFVLDREVAIDGATGVRARYAADGRVRFGDAPDPLAAAALATDAARAAGLARLCVVTHPAYPRLDPPWYGGVAAGLARYEALRREIGYRKLAGAKPRVLLLWRPYFLYREIETALARLGLAHERLDMGRGEHGETAVIEGLLAAVARFKPDFALTVNHLGLDREGRLTALLAEIGLPLASWFVDSPRLVLHDYAGLAGPGVMLFSYDADMVAAMAEKGFGRAAWLPLATDPDRFSPRGPVPGHPWQTEVSFVGASMNAQAASALAVLPRPLARAVAAAATDFAASPERDAGRFLAGHAATAAGFAALVGAPARLQAELALTWEATRRIRQDCVSRLLPLRPLIAGDDGWEAAYPGCGTAWRRLPPLDYYDELPLFYPQSAVSLNTTSLQMKGAVNQRVFDVPACGGFVVTDAREQLDALFEPGRETAVYAEPGEITELVRHYLARPAERERISAAARRRILATHTYGHRLTELVAAMQKAFGR
jgi:spore maturation protein CgeB